ncbi:MAG: phosphoribosyltransferase family protein [Alphaproteobacteria bacterium]
MIGKEFRLWLSGFARRSVGPGAIELITAAARHADRPAAALIEREPTMYQDRRDAGRRLAEPLLKYKDKRPVILGLPRGGVMVASEIAKALEAPLDVVLVQKISAPNHTELAVGAVAFIDHPETVIVPEVQKGLKVSRRYLKEETQRQLEEIDRRRKLYQAGRPRVDVRGCTAIVVDDGIATGATTQAALRAVRKSRPRTLVLAVPVAPDEAIDTLRPEADEIVCLESLSGFGAISLFYSDFEQLDDDQVVDMLLRSP